MLNVVAGFVDDEYRYIVLELCSGLDLVDSLIAELSLESGELLMMHPNVPHVSAVFREMVRAVGQVHSQGIAHMVTTDSFLTARTTSVTIANHFCLWLSVSPTSLRLCLSV